MVKINTKKLTKFLGLKAVRLLILLIVVAAISFIMIQLSPIDPVRAYLGQRIVSQEQLAIMGEYWGTNLTLTERVMGWLSTLASGSMGFSLIYRVPVTEVIFQKFTASLTLMAVSWIISAFVGFGLGIVAGAKEGTLTDKAIKTYCYILQSSPTFWIGLVFLMVFSVYLGWFPIGLSVPIGQLSDTVTFWQWLDRLILPAITLSVVGIASITMYTRDKLINVKKSDYFLFAQARGESFWGIIKNHGIRNVLLPAITLQFLSFNELFGGTILVEQVFSYPGIGQATVAAGLRSDVPLLLGIVLISAVFVFTGNFIADLIYQYVDPRIRSVDDE
ncbi:MAG: ABC transporter permease [Methanosphaera sp.]|nr:ABC transporter permease [Methanosphaera sp.]